MAMTVSMMIDEHKTLSPRTIEQWGHEGCPVCNTPTFMGFYVGMLGVDSEALRCASVIAEEDEQGGVMAIPNPDECRIAAAGLLSRASETKAQRPELMQARALTAIGYLLLGAQQGPQLNAEDQASWSPLDGPG